MTVFLKKLLFSTTIVVFDDCYYDIYCRINPYNFFMKTSIVQEKKWMITKWMSN